VYTARLVEEMARSVDVEVFVDGDGDGDVPPTPSSDPRIVVRPAGSFAAVEAATGGFEAVVVCIGNSELHSAALSLVRLSRIRPVTMLHDVRLTDLYRHGVARGAVPEGFDDALASMYGPMPRGLVDDGWIRPEVAERHGVLMAREIVARSARVLVTSEFAAHLARMDARGADGDRIVVVPHAYPDATPVRGDRDEHLLGSFGLVNAVKEPLLVVRALALLRRQGREARLVFAGPVSEHDRREVEEESARQGVGTHVELTGLIGSEAYADLLSRVALAVQLRARSNGEASGAVHDCIAGGLPLVVTEIGAARELPDFVDKVSPDISPEDLAVLLDALLGDRERRRDMAEAGRSFARTRSFAHVARMVLGAAGLHTPAP
jgi:glycosyltransferase involved in cell wall biosynthesis